MRADSGRRAFTLVELLVVIGIIAVLIAILIPVLSRVSAQSKLVACKANIRTQLQAHASYAVDFRDHKPPLFQPRTSSVRVDWASPDTRWNGKGVGQGLLVEGGFLTYEVLLDPSEVMDRDADRDRGNWNANLLNVGSSYVYFWRHPSDAPDTGRNAAVGATYQRANALKHRATVMCLNLEPGHKYLGEYQNRAWVSHPTVKKVNVGYIDGSVQDAGVDELKMYYPGGSFEELDWFDRANKRY